MTPPLRPPGRRERGVATLFITVVLLLSVGLIALYTSRSAVAEQRLSANEVRARQALAAANAGIDHALAYMRNGGLDHDNDDVVDTIAANTLTSAGGTPSYYRVLYVDSSLALPICPSSRTGAFAAGAPVVPTEVTAVSCGWSDDDSSVQRVAQRLTATPSTGGGISTPLVTRGATNLLTGGASLLNFFNDLTVWSGGSLLGQSNTGKTFIRNRVTNPTADQNFDYRNTGNSPACNNPPGGYTCSTQGSVLGHDTVGGDTNLSSKSVDQFFQYFMGQTPTTYRENTATWVVDTNNTLSTQNSTDVGSIGGMKNNVIWVEGNLTLPSLGTADRPVVLVVTGNLQLSSNAVVYGLLFVMGDVTGNGNPEIFGSLISAGTASASGNPIIVYDPLALGRAANLGRAVKLPGTWRDW